MFALVHWLEEYQSVKLNKALVIDRPKVVWGTLGRVLDVIERGYLDLKDLRMLILDEADQICKRRGNEKAFKQFQKIVNNISLKNVRICAFSATFWLESESYILNTLMNSDPWQVIKISSDIVSSDILKDCPNNIQEFYIKTSSLPNIIPNPPSNPSEQKCQFLLHLLNSLSYNQAIIFYNTKALGHSIFTSLQGKFLS